MATLERAITAAARTAFNNKSLRNKDIQEWSTLDIKPHDGEVVLWLSDLDVFVAIKQEHDKRKKKV